MLYHPSSSNPVLLIHRETTSLSDAAPLIPRSLSSARVDICRPMRVVAYSPYPQIQSRRTELFKL